MTEGMQFSKSFRWILRGLVLGLLVLLGARLVADPPSWISRRQPLPEFRPGAVVPSIAPAHAPPAKVPPPKYLRLADIPAPLRWAQLAVSNEISKLDFSIDLDYFAPLGDGPANAAVWFRDFARGDGSRAVELEKATLGRQTLFGETRDVFPADHPLLREAEPWVDQASCSFYPEVWKAEGISTNVPNLMFAINLARSWASRGEKEKDPERAREDFRRAIRLGRLFMQDDVTLLQHLIGWACVSYGLRGLNELARREGDAVMLAATTLALGDFNSMRDLVARWMSETKFDEAFHERWWGWRISLEDSQVDGEIAHARTGPLRCLRIASIFRLVVIEHEGTRRQKRTAAAALSELARDPDPQLAALVGWMERQPYDRASYLPWAQ